MLSMLAGTLLFFSNLLTVSLSWTSAPQRSTTLSTHCYPLICRIYRNDILIFSHHQWTMFPCPCDWKFHAFSIYTDSRIFLRPGLFWAFLLSSSHSIVQTSSLAHPVVTAVTRTVSLIVANFCLASLRIDMQVSRYPWCILPEPWILPFLSFLRRSNRLYHRYLYFAIGKFEDFWDCIYQHSTIHLSFLLPYRM
jgi:hypothetical protein